MASVSSSRDKNRPDSSTSLTPSIISRMAASSASWISPPSSLSYICKQHTLSLQPFWTGWYQIWRVLFSPRRPAAASPLTLVGRLWRGRWCNAWCLFVLLHALNKITDSVGFVCSPTSVGNTVNYTLPVSVFTWSKSLWMCVSVSVTGSLRNWAKSSRDSWSPCSFLALLTSSSSCFSEVSALSLLMHKES